MRYDNILQTVGRTPIVRINKLAPEGVNLFVKLESFNPMSSVKDRMALAVIEAAERGTGGHAARRDAAPTIHCGVPARAASASSRAASCGLRGVSTRVGTRPQSAGPEAILLRQPQVGAFRSTACRPGCRRRTRRPRARAP